MPLSLVKSYLLLGSVLLVGGGVTAAAVAPELTKASVALRHRIKWGTGVGALLLLTGSALDIALTLIGVLGSLTPELMGRYLTSTRHGHAVLVRAVLTFAVLLSLALVRQKSLGVTSGAQRAWTTGIYVVLSFLLLGTFSYTSHAAAMGGTPPLMADLIHFAAAAAWAGPLLYMALLPNWGTPYLSGLQDAFKRVSFVGLLSVVTLFITGIYTTLIHLQAPARFATSPYGFALYAKVAVVLLIVGLATLNRFWLLSAFLQRGALRFRNAVRVEGVLLVVVLVATGILTTSALPNGAGEPDAWKNFAQLVVLLKRKSINAQVCSTSDTDRHLRCLCPAGRHYRLRRCRGRHPTRLWPEIPKRRECRDHHRVSGRPPLRLQLSPPYRRRRGSPSCTEQDGLWQYENVALLDFEDKTGGCRDVGTVETNAQVVGTVPEGDYTGLTFDLGVPFELNHIDASTAPSPLNVDLHVLGVAVRLQVRPHRDPQRPDDDDGHVCCRHCRGRQRSWWSGPCKLLAHPPWFNRLRVARSCCRPRRTVWQAERQHHPP